LNSELEPLSQRISQIRQGLGVAGVISGNGGRRLAERVDRLVQGGLISGSLRQFDNAMPSMDSIAGRLRRSADG